MSLTNEQKEFRRQHWTASDTAMALTGNFGGLYRVVATKVHGLDDDGDEEFQEFGEAAEPIMRRWLRDKRAMNLEGPARVICQDDELLAAHLDDRTYWGPDAIYVPVEIKCHGFFSDFTDVSEWGDEESGRVSDYSLFQNMHQQICCHTPHGYVAAWIRGRGKLLYRIERNEELCKTIREFAHWAWDKYIVPGVLPEPTEETAPLALRAMQAIERTPSKQIAPTLALRNACAFYGLVRASRLAAEKVEEHTKALILHHMGDADTCDLGDSILSIKRVHNKGYTKVIEPFSYDRIDIHEQKGLLTNGRRTSSKRLTSQS